MGETCAASPCQPRGEPEYLPDQHGVVNGPSGENRFVDIALNKVLALKRLAAAKTVKSIAVWKKMWNCV